MDIHCQESAWWLSVDGSVTVEFPEGPFKWASFRKCLLCDCMKSQTVACLTFSNIYAARPSQQTSTISWPGSSQPPQWATNLSNKGVWWIESQGLQGFLRRWFLFKVTIWVNSMGTSRQPRYDFVAPQGPPQRCQKSEPPCSPMVRTYRSDEWRHNSYWWGHHHPSKYSNVQRAQYPPW